MNRRTLPALNVVAIGGVHQFPHFVPVACELAARGVMRVTVFVTSDGEAAMVRSLAARLNLPVPEIIEMRLPRSIDRVAGKSTSKLLRLIRWARRLRGGDAILCAERTSTLLKRLPGRCPPLIHIPHGAGDRAVGFEPRFRFFDSVLVAGEKDRERLIEQGVVAAERCAVAGPIKVAALARCAAMAPPLFDNDRLTLLYCPHFDASLGSFAVFADRLIERIAADPRYNLIVAPHIRLAGSWGEAQRAEWVARSVPGKILVDPGSERSTDMRYTLTADLFIGDVSSQVYEFLVRPRPCLFIDAHGADWQGNPDYAMWTLGEVVPPDCDIGAAVAQAFATHDRYRPLQEARVRRALDGLHWTADGGIAFDPDPIARAASLIEGLIRR